MENEGIFGLITELKYQTSLIQKSKLEKVHEAILGGFYSFCKQSCKLNVWAKEILKNLFHTFQAKFTIYYPLNIAEVKTM